MLLQNLIRTRKKQNRVKNLISETSYTHGSTINYSAQKSFGIKAGESIQYAKSYILSFTIEYNIKAYPGLSASIHSFKLGAFGGYKQIFFNEIATSDSEGYISGVHNVQFEFQSGMSIDDTVTGGNRIVFDFWFANKVGTITIKDILLIPSTNLFGLTKYTQLNRKTDTTMFTARGFEYLSYYRVQFNYRVNIYTVPPTNELAFASQNNGAFTYYLMKTVPDSKTTLGVHTGSVDYYIQATKNAGDHMNLLFRPWTGVADITIENVIINKVG